MQDDICELLRGAGQGMLCQGLKNPGRQAPMATKKGKVATIHSEQI